MDACPQTFQMTGSRLDRDWSWYGPAATGGGPRRTSLSACPAQAGPADKEVMGARLDMSRRE